jgi:predicted hotdog family 3-hydroxylacyl-ACP dehydratase
MVVLTRVLRHDRDETVCAARIGPDDVFATKSGEVPALMGIEYMAQCIAAHAGLAGRASGELPRVGFLLGTRRVTFHVPRYRCGQQLSVTARRLWGGTQGLVAFDCRIDDVETGAVLAEGRLNCFTPGGDVAGSDSA